jgi:hypothetical protein
MIRSLPRDYGSGSVPVAHRQNRPKTLLSVLSVPAGHPARLPVATTASSVAPRATLDGRPSTRLTTILRHDVEPVALPAVRLRPLPPRHCAAQNRRAIRNALQRLQPVQCDVSQPRTVRRTQYRQPQRGDAAGGNTDQAKALSSCADQTVAEGCLTSTAPRQEHSPTDRSRS